jgi:hypothetical protein
VRDNNVVNSATWLVNQLCVGIFANVLPAIRCKPVFDGSSSWLARMGRAAGQQQTVTHQLASLFANHAHSAFSLQPVKAPFKLRASLIIMVSLASSAETSANDAARGQ